MRAISCKQVLLLLVFQFHDPLADKFPNSLKVLMLSGNPCAQDSVAIRNLQEKFPQLQIIILEEDTTPEETPHTLSASSSLPETISSARGSSHSNDINSPIIVDPEVVLREVVDRKCRLQSLASPMSIEALTKVLICLDSTSTP